MILAITGNILKNKLKEVLNQVTHLKSGNENFGECKQLIVEFSPKKRIPTAKNLEIKNFKQNVSRHLYKSF